MKYGGNRLDIQVKESLGLEAMPGECLTGDEPALGGQFSTSPREAYAAYSPCSCSCGQFRPEKWKSLSQFLPRLRRQRRDSPSLCPLRLRNAGTPRIDPFDQRHKC